MPTESSPPKEASDEISSCPACGSHRFSKPVSSLDPICDDCGAVISDTVEHVELQEEPDDELSTELSWAEYYTISNSTEQQVASALEVLESISDGLTLATDVRKRAAEIYTEVAVENLTDGRSTDLMVGAVVALAARELGDPRPTGLIANAAAVRTGSLRRLIRQLPRELDWPSTVCRPGEYLPYLRQQLHLEGRHEAEALELLNSLDETTVSGKSPVGFAGAALYLAAGGVVTQRTIAQTAGITGETLRVRLRDIRSSGVVG
ncbi:hypothetical protein [Haloarchaeobius sp. HRN-SO-5]|uniref:hypothetical protein n=1 Tax=Haloarchaeobius sp. HRN-SO-5 TaxID=3446118 RepID=UPI003EBFDC88